MKHKLKAFRLTFSFQSTRRGDRELRPSLAFHAVFVAAFKRSMWGRPSEGRLARGAPLRPRDIDAESARDIDAESARARNAERARKARSDAPLPHSQSLPPAGRCRRRLARASASEQVCAAGWPEPQPARALAPQAGPKPAAASELALQACTERSICSSCALSLSTTCSRTRLGQASRKRSGYRTFAQFELQRRRPEPRRGSGGSGGAAAPWLTTFPRRLTWPPNPDCAGRVVVLSPGARSPPPCWATCSANNSTSSSRLGGVRGGRRGGQRGTAWGGGAVAAAAARCDRCSSTARAGRRPAGRADALALPDGGRDGIGLRGSRHRRLHRRHCARAATRRLGLGSWRWRSEVGWRGSRTPWRRSGGAL